MRIGGFGVVLAVLLLGTIFAFSTPFAYAQACTITLPYGQQTDSDCDGIADTHDNCPADRNSDQIDTNYNGRGDACDALIQVFVIQPDSHLRQGEFGHITVRVVNNRGDSLRDVTVRMRNDQLDIDVEQTIANIPRGGDATMDFWLRIPKCARVGEYPLTLMLSQRAGTENIASGESGSHTITVEKGDVCGTSDSALDTTIINAFQSIDLDQGESTLLPITIINLGEEQATYTIAVSGFSDAGTWRIDPEKKMTVAAGTSATATLYLVANEAATPGKRDLTIQVSAEGKTTSIDVDMYIRSPIAKIAQPAIAPLLIYGLLIPLLVLLLAGAIIFAMIRERERKRSPVENERTIQKSTQSTNAKKKKTVGVEKTGRKKEFRTNY